MPNEKSRKRRSRSLARDAKDWGAQFVKVLELEYAEALAELPLNAAPPEYRRAMMSAILKVLAESGTTDEEIVKLLQQSTAQPVPAQDDGPWTEEKNARRMTLIDKMIQQTMTVDETIELQRLTEQLRAHCDLEEMAPLEGARRIHRRLLDRDEPPRTRH